MVQQTFLRHTGLPFHPLFDLLTARVHCVDSERHVGLEAECETLPLPNLETVDVVLTINTDSVHRLWIGERPYKTMGFGR